MATLTTADTRRTQGQPRLALSKRETAEALGISVDHLERHVWPELRVVRTGRRTFVPTRELDLWLERSAARTLPE